MSSEEMVSPARAEAILIAGDESALPARPGRVRRFAAGAWHVPGGAIFLLGRPRLWPLALLPAVLGLAAIGGGLVLGVYGVRGVDELLGQPKSKLPDLLDLGALLGRWSGMLGAGVLAGLAIVVLLTAPLLEWLGRRAEETYHGPTPGRAPHGREISRALRHALYLIPGVPVAFLLCLVPFVGPIAAALVMALVLAFQFTAPALARRGQTLSAMWKWHRTWRAEALGFGVAAVVLLPLLSPLLAPALAVGASLLVHEICGEAPPEPVTPPSPLPEATDA